jgi:hypothetical protein
MPIDPKTASPVTWFHHAVDRENYWSAMRPDELSRNMIAQWQREKMLAYRDMTKEERASLPHGM